MAHSTLIPALGAIAVATALVAGVSACEPSAESRASSEARQEQEARTRAYLRQTRVAKVCNLHGGVYFVYRGPDGRLFLSPYREATRHYDRLRPFDNLDPIAPGVSINEVC